MDLLKYYTTYEAELKSRQPLKNFKDFIDLAKYKYSCSIDFCNYSLKNNFKYFNELIRIALILDICYEVYEDYLNYLPDDTMRHLFYLLFSTELIRDFNDLINQLITDDNEKLKIFDKFSNRVDYEKENIFKHILEYLDK